MTNDEWARAVARNPFAIRHSSFVIGFITLLSLGLLVGCRRDPDPAVESRPPVANRKTAETLEQQEARMDATVWRDEVLAQVYERTFVKLGDELRAATNKVAALARFDFDEIVVVKPAGGPALLPLG